MYNNSKSYSMEFENKIYNAIEKLESGDKSYLKIVYEAFSSENSEIVKKAGGTLKAHLEGKTAKYIITLSERFREYSSLEWSIAWSTIDITKKKAWFDSEKDYIYALIVGSFHPNGYFRESCSKELYNYPNTLGYILLRVNDWVIQIRDAMFILALKKIENCSIEELFIAVPYMEKLSHSGRIDYGNKKVLLEMFDEKMEKALPDLSLDKIRYFEFPIRRKIYKLSLEKKVWNLSDINYLLEHEKHSFCKQVLIVGILQYYHCSQEQLDGYLKNKNSIVRRKAMEYKYAVTKGYWDNLELMLLDESKGVRELAAYIIRHHSDIHILSFYMEHLKDQNPVAAIVGIGENGGKEEGKQLLPFLKSSVSKVVSTTLTALSKTIKMDGYNIYLEYLVSREPAVSKAAYYAIQCNNIHYGAEKLYQYCRQYEYPHVGKYAMLLLIQENSWNRLPYLLDLYTRNEFEAYQDWLWRAIIQRDMYGTISKQQEKKINRILKETEELLPKQLLKEIRFDMKFVVER